MVRAQLRIERKSRLAPPALPSSFATDVAEITGAPDLPRSKAAVKCGRYCQRQNRLANATSLGTSRGSSAKATSAAVLRGWVMGPSTLPCTQHSDVI